MFVRNCTPKMRPLLEINNLESMASAIVRHGYEYITTSPSDSYLQSWLNALHHHEGSFINSGLATHRGRGTLSIVREAPTKILQEGFAYQKNFGLAQLFDAKILELHKFGLIVETMRRYGYPVDDQKQTNKWRSLSLYSLVNPFLFLLISLCACALLAVVEHMIGVMNKKYDWDVTVAFPELKHLFRDYICSKRTLSFVVTAKNGVAGCWSNRFMLTYESAHSKISSKTRKPLVDDEKGWQKLWNCKIIRGLKIYSNLRSLKLRGSGSSGGGILLKSKWLQKLSESLPHLETLSLFHGVLITPVESASYEGPIGLYKVRVGPNSLKDWDKTSLCFPSLKTLKLGYPTKGVLDLIAQPDVLPNLERLFIMSKTYVADEYLNRFTYCTKSKLREFMHIPSKCRLPRQSPRYSNSGQEPGSALEIFLDHHKAQLEAFCFDPIPEKMTPKVLNYLSQMPKLRKLALCEKNAHVAPTRRGRQEFDRDKNPMIATDFVCRSVENLFLDAGPNFPEFWLSEMLRTSAWTLRTLKIWNCPSIAAETLVEIRRCQNLEKLEFTRVKNLDSPTLQAILEANGGKLRVLIVRQCPGVSKSTIMCVVNLECPNLARRKLLINEGRQQAYDEIQI